jgi:hypothetical protein
MPNLRPEGVTSGLAVIRTEAGKAASVRMSLSRSQLKKGPYKELHISDGAMTKATRESDMLWSQR